MSWDHQSARSGNHVLYVQRSRLWKKKQWSYHIVWSTETAFTVVGRGSERYDDVYAAREAAILHLASILPTAQSKRLLELQSDLVWGAWPKPR